jgi:hypothetical protein
MIMPRSVQLGLFCEMEAFFFVDPFPREEFADLVEKHIREREVPLNKQTRSGSVYNRTNVPRRCLIVSTGRF